MSDTPQLSVLVLDYRKPHETRLCLQSLRYHLKVPAKIVYLDNGGNEAYPWSLYQEGLCDVLISKRRGQGGGFGQTDLFRWCDTRYALFVQSDQTLIHDITPDLFDKLTAYLNGGFKCVDLNGDQSHRGVWTDRAHLIETAFFNSLAPFPNGGPGLDHVRWNENYLQERFEELGNPIAHVRPALFRDNGHYTVRELPCGGVVRMRTDTKSVRWLVTPKRPYQFPEMSDEEWRLSITDQWPAGKIPQAYLDKTQSFNCWGDIEP